MTKNELIEKIKPLAVGLNNTLASKQHVFNNHLEDVADCKKMGIRNQLIVEAINSHLNESEKITITYFKNLLFRSGYKKSERRTNINNYFIKTTVRETEDKYGRGKKFGNFKIPQEKTFKHDPKSDDDLFTKG